MRLIWCHFKFGLTFWKGKRHCKFQSAVICFDFCVGSNWRGLLIGISAALACHCFNQYHPASCWSSSVKWVSASSRFGVVLLCLTCLKQLWCHDIILLADPMMRWCSWVLVVYFGAIITCKTSKTVLTTTRRDAGCLVFMLQVMWSEDIVHDEVPFLEDGRGLKSSHRTCLLNLRIETKVSFEV